MVVIYTQDFCCIKNSIKDAKSIIYELYGEELGAEAFASLKSERIGSSYRKSGGPLIKIVSKEEAGKIKTKETEIGMLRECA